MSEHTLLGLASLVLFAGLAVPRLFPRWPPWGRALWRLAVLAALTVLVQRLLGSPLQPRFPPDAAGEHFWEQCVEAGWWIVAARSAIGLVRLFVVLENRPRETQIVSDLLAGAIYLASLLAIVDIVFAVPVAGLVATSGVFAIVLGLALQSTLSDVFSGIAVGVERPYKAGDLLWVEGGIEGHVLQVNWRSTHIATGQNNIAVVPNSVIAKARLINHSLGSPVRADTIEVRLDPAATPERCVATLTAATRSCRLLLPTPPPRVAQTGLQGDSAAYEIGFSVASSEQLAAARAELFARMQRHLRHAGIALAVPGAASVPLLAPFTPSELLAQSDLFGAIAPRERDLLADQLVETGFAPGETPMRQGDAPHALFVLAAGAVEFTTTTPGYEHLVYRVSPGASFGAVGLLTDTPYGTTATALTPVRAWRLDKAGIAAAIRLRPELAGALEDLAHRGQAAMSSALSEHEESHTAHPEMFLSRMRSVLRKLAAGNPQG